MDNGDKMIEKLIEQNWTKRMALDCWTRFNELYTAKHSKALHAAMMQGTTDSYIERETKVFDRYAKMYYHVTMKMTEYK